LPAHPLLNPFQEVEQINWRKLGLQLTRDIEEFGLIRVSYRLGFVKGGKLFYGCAGLDVLQRLKDVGLSIPKVGAKAQINLMK
jgi:hypothetical protein